jgi:hypothetical protein
MRMNRPGGRAPPATTARPMIWNAAWQAELSKPTANRQWFRSGDLLDELARDPQTLEIRKLSRWMLRFAGEFAKSSATRIQYRQSGDDEVAILSRMLTRRDGPRSVRRSWRGEPLSYEPLPPPSPGSILVFSENAMLGRNFVQRFIKAHAALPNATPL